MMILICLLTMLNVATRLVAEAGLIEPNTSTFFSDINAQQATAVAVITSGYVSDIIITNIGYGYSDTPCHKLQSMEMRLRLQRWALGII